MREMLSPLFIGSLWVQVLFVLLITVVVDAVSRRMISSILLAMKDGKRTSPVIKLFMDSIRLPAILIIYTIGISVSISIVNEVHDITLLSKIKSLRGILLLLYCSLFLYSFVKGLKDLKIKEISKSGVGDKTVVQMSFNILNIILFVIFGLFVLQESGLSVSGLLAFGGVGGLIAGLSAKEFLSDFFGGLSIMLDKPFKVGDWISSPDRDIEGHVEEIGMRRVCIRRFSKRPLYIPNSTFNTIAIENPSRSSHWRVSETIGLRHSDLDSMGSVTKKIKDMLVEHTGIDEDQTLLVNFSSYSDYSLDFYVYCFTRTTEWSSYIEIKHNILIKIGDIIKESGAELATPMQRIKVGRE